MSLAQLLTSAPFTGPKNPDAVLADIPKGLKKVAHLVRRYVPFVKPEATEEIAIAHDYLTQRGGAERVVLAMHRAFPDPVRPGGNVPRVQGRENHHESSEQDWLPAP